MLFSPSDAKKVTFFSNYLPTPYVKWMVPNVLFFLFLEKRIWKN